MSKPNTELEELRSSFQTDVQILSKHHPISEVGARAFDNNESAIQSLLKAERNRVLLEVEGKAEPWYTVDREMIKAVPLTAIQQMRGE